MTKKYPENWKDPFKENILATLEENEKLKSFFVLELIDRTTREIKEESIFVITTKNNKTIGKLVEMEIEQPKNSNEIIIKKINTGIYAEYPENEKQALIEETMEIIKTMAIKIHLEGEKENLDIDINKPMFGIQAKDNSTNKQIAIDICKINDDFNLQRQLVIEILGLEKEITKENIQKIKNLIDEIELTTQNEKQTKKKEEKELIKKYGLEKIQKLAKKIDYHGEIINNK